MKNLCEKCKSSCYYRIVYNNSTDKIMSTYYFDSSNQLYSAVGSPNALDEIDNISYIEFVHGKIYADRKEIKPDTKKGKENLIKMLERLSCPYTFEWNVMLENEYKNM